jgi:hypothetical protein
MIYHWSCLTKINHEWKSNSTSFPHKPANGMRFFSRWHQTSVYQLWITCAKCTPNSQNMSRRDRREKVHTSSWNIFIKEFVCSPIFALCSAAAHTNQKMQFSTFDGHFSSCINSPQVNTSGTFSSPQVSQTSHQSHGHRSKHTTKAEQEYHSMSCQQRWKTWQNLKTKCREKVPR